MGEKMSLRQNWFLRRDHEFRSVGLVFSIAEVFYVNELESNIAHFEVFVPILNDSRS